jgi:hypothetical protein
MIYAVLINGLEAHRILEYSLLIYIKVLNSQGGRLGRSLLSLRFKDLLYIKTTL